MTKALLEWETIDAEQINDIMAGKEPTPPKSALSVKSSNDKPSDGVSPNAPATV
jgi:cell division protease FtsH